jgi:predicted nucleotidyltransferase
VNGYNQKPRVSLTYKNFVRDKFSDLPGKNIMPIKIHSKKTLQSTKDINGYLSLIVERLKKIEPYKIILFGSCADGEIHIDTDIDLIVVLNEKGIIRSYKEKVRNRMKVGKKLLDIERQIPIDTLVYTLDEWELFLNQKSSFSKVVTDKGIILYEANNERLAQ